MPASSPRRPSAAAGRLPALAAILLLLLPLLAPLTTGEAAPPTAASTPPAAAQAQPPAAPPAAPDRVLVKFRAEARPAMGAAGALRTARPTLDRLLAQEGVRQAAPLLPALPALSVQGAAKAADTAGLARIYRLSLAPGRDVHQVVAALAAHPDVEYAEPDYLAERAEAPNDPRYAEQWALSQLQLEAAWQVTGGSATTVIAVVDSGIDLEHPDLRPNLWTNPGEIPANGLDDDANGFVDDVQGWNFVHGTNDLWDDNGHGTLVAGIAAARTNNGLGMAGVCGACRIMPVKVMQPSGAANYSDIAAGVLYATAKGAKVINLSLGGYADSRTLRETIAAAIAQNVVVVGGVGNDHSSAPFYPAAYPEVLAVAGTTISDTRTAFTNFGAWVDVAAPGEAILTTALGSDYVQTSGTSMASPFGAGLAGLLLSLHPDWSPALVRAQLLQTADPIDALNPGYEGQLGRGRLNAARAIQPPRPILSYAGYSADGTPNGRPDFGAGTSLSVALYNDWADASNVVATLATTDPLVTVVSGTVPFGDIRSGQTVANGAPFAVEIATAAGYSHPIPFSLALAANGGAYTATLTFTVTTRSSLEPVAGTIAGDTVWTNDKTYVVTNNVGVAPGVTLTIQPGTVVTFNGDYTLNVGGTLIADGTSNHPIVFAANTAGTWNRIYFDDPSSDAVVLSDGTYQSGTLLRHVQVQGAANGLVCNSATPFLAHLTLDTGGINCPLGSSPFWLLDSTVSGTVSASGDGKVWRSTIGGFISLGSGSVENSTAGGNVSLSSGTVVSTTITNGSISLSVGTVLSNTVQRGGISIGTGGTVRGNSIEQAPGTAIQTGGTVTVTANRVVESGGAGIVVSTGLVQGNLIAGSAGDGLRVGAATVISNTFTGVRGRALYTSGGIPLKIAGNNFEFNPGPYDLYNDNPIGPTSYVIAQRNWWGTTDTATIAGRIFDFDDDYNKGRVSYTPVVTAPSPDAPAYVRQVTVLPDTTLGIQTGTFELEFNREMNASVRPEVELLPARRGKWIVHDSSSTGLPNFEFIRDIAIDNEGVVWVGSNGVLRFDGVTWTAYDPTGRRDRVTAIAFDHDGTKWFGTDGGGVIRYDGTTWTVFNTANSGLPDDYVQAIAVDQDRTKWLGTSGGGVARYNGTTWTVFNISNSGLPNNEVLAIAVDQDGTKWFGTIVGLARYDGTTWTVFNTSNSGLPSNTVQAIAIDQDGTKWLGTSGGGGVGRYDGTTWTVFSGLPRDDVQAIAIDQDGTKWFGTPAGAARFDDTNWTIFNPSNSGLLDDQVSAIAIDRDGDTWLGNVGPNPDGSTSSRGAVSVLLWGEDFSVMDTGQWLSPTRYRVTYDFNTLVPRDTYTVTVSGAQGADGLLIAPNSAYTLTVDYAGYINDTTLPDPPAVTAWGEGTTTLGARWSASDPDSAITQYRYAIGTAPGATDVVNWTTIGVTETVRAGLNLLRGQSYYIAVKARNEGGLWSEPGVSNVVVAGLPRPCAGDVTGDQRVDVADIQRLAAAFRQPTYDVVGGDGVVTLLDVMVAAAQFNTSCP